MGTNCFPVIVPPRLSSIGVHLQCKAPAHRSSTIICCCDRDGVVALWPCINDSDYAISRVYTKASRETRRGSYQVAN